MDVCHFVFSFANSCQSPRLCKQTLQLMDRSGWAQLYRYKNKLCAKLNRFNGLTQVVWIPDMRTWQTVKSDRSMRFFYSIGSVLLQPANEPDSINGCSWNVVNGAAQAFKAGSLHSETFVSVDKKFNTITLTSSSNVSRVFPLPCQELQTLIFPRLNSVGFSGLKIISSPISGGLAIEQQVLFETYDSPEPVQFPECLSKHIVGVHLGPIRNAESNTESGVCSGLKMNYKNYKVKVTSTDGETLSFGTTLTAQYFFSKGVLACPDSTSLIVATGRVAMLLKIEAKFRC